ncbi:MAG: CBS domain-containing protein [Anaerolineae bacterium]|jgi:acetoin utilization protein AcuB
MFVSDRMSSPAVTITPDTPFQDALKLMRERRFRRLPVVNKRGKLVGIVSERDLLYASPSQATSLNVWELRDLLSKVQVREIMTQDVITTTPDTPVENASHLMVENKIGGLPVVDEERRVVGVITETDIFKAFNEMFADGYSGLRLTLQVPGKKSALADLCWTISEMNGHIVSVGSFSDGGGAERGTVVVKVQGVREDQLVGTLEALGDHVLDVREV